MTTARECQEGHSERCASRRCQTPNDDEFNLGYQTTLWVTIRRQDLRTLAIEVSVVHS